MKTGAVIAAAGLSSRMKAFKPLLALPGRNHTVIQTAIYTLRLAGVEQIVVVTGRDAPKLERHLSGCAVQCVHNAHYADSDMFYSACLGFSALEEDVDRVFFLPADVPLFAANSLSAMSDYMDCTGCGILLPLCGGQRGHPVLIRKNMLPALLSFRGEGGLRGAIDGLNCKKQTLEMHDRGTVMDADHPEDYERLKEYACSEEYLCRRDAKAVRIPDDEECMELLRAAGTPTAVTEHCRAVSAAAGALAHRLHLLAGLFLNEERLGAAGLLHDIDRSRPNHAAAGASRLEGAGYLSLAYLVARHMELLPEEAGLNEAALLWLADKCCDGSEFVNPAERFAAKERRYAGNSSALERIEGNRRIAETIIAQWEEATKEAFSAAIKLLSERKLKE